MPVLKTFRGQPITRLKRLANNRLQVTFANVASGDRHKRTVITQKDWDDHGDSRYVENMPDLRALATCASV